MFITNLIIFLIYPIIIGLIIAGLIYFVYRLFFKK